MKKFFKWIGILLVALVGLLLIAVISLYFIGNASLNKTYDFAPSNITIPSDAEASTSASIAPRRFASPVTAKT